MFIHKEQLGYLLPRDAYFSERQHELEFEKLFQPAWHLVGLTSQMPQSGDFRTLELLGHRLLIRNQDGRFSAYRNVCSHRHCLLTNSEQGNSPTIRCQYHGWEYQETGRVSKVPDGGCFKPFDREQSRLQTFPLEVCGGLLFVSLSEKPVSLQEFLGPFYAAIQRCSQEPWRHNWHWSHSYPCNWKLPVENTLETYHLPCVHEKTFGGIYPTEESQTHDLRPGSTTLRYQMDDSDRLVRRQKRVMRLISTKEATSEYIHHHIHPHLVFTFTDLYMHTQIYLPTSPTSARTEVWMFSLRGDRRGPLARVLGPLIARYGRKTNTVIQTEDAGVFGAQQRGVENSPHRGCLGTREERIYAFQHYVARTCFGPDAVPALPDREPAAVESELLMTAAGAPS